MNTNAAASRIAVDVAGGRVVVRLPERCDLEDAVSLRGALLESVGAGDIVVEWGPDPTLHTAVTQVLLACARDVRARGGAFSVATPSPELGAWLDACGAGTWLRGRGLVHAGANGGGAHE